MREMCTRCLRPKATERDYEDIPEGEGEHLCWGEWSKSQCHDEATSLTDRLRLELLRMDKDHTYLRHDVPMSFAEFNCIAAEMRKLRELIDQREDLPSVCRACADAGREPPRLEWNGKALACPTCGADGMADDPA